MKTVRELACRFLLTPLALTLSLSVVAWASQESKKEAELQNYLSAATQFYLSEDYIEAEKWFRKAAELGDGSAQFYLGSMYAHGQGVPQDSGEALKWLRKAVENGFFFARVELGEMYAYGEGVPQDYAEAVKWFRKPAEEGLAYPQFEMGFMYLNGLGVKRDDSEAIKWFRKVAERGRRGTHLRLVSVDRANDGMQAIFGDALKRYQETAKEKLTFSQLGLATMYEQGQGVPQDSIQALMWLNIALSEYSGEGREVALRHRNSLTESMTSEQIAEAQRLASQYKFPSEKKKQN